jgi:hypothetical protein
MRPKDQVDTLPGVVSSLFGKLKAYMPVSNGDSSPWLFDSPTDAEHCQE